MMNSKNWPVRLADACTFCTLLNKTCFGGYGDARHCLREYVATQHLLAAAINSGKGNIDDVETEVKELWNRARIATKADPNNLGSGIAATRLTLPAKLCSSDEELGRRNAFNIAIELHANSAQNDNIVKHISKVSTQNLTWLVDGEGKVRMMVESLITGILYPLRKMRCLRLVNAGRVGDKVGEFLEKEEMTSDQVSRVVSMIEEMYLLDVQSLNSSGFGNMVEYKAPIVNAEQALLNGVLAGANFEEALSAYETFVIKTSPSTGNKAYEQLCLYITRIGDAGSCYPFGCLILETGRLL